MKVTLLDLPTGSVIPYAGSTAPSGYLFCDGSAVSRTAYANLFSVIAETFGEGDNSTTFNIPDLRGRFVRGVDGSANRDPDKASRTASATGGNTGNNVGSVQGDAFEGHDHAGNYYGTNGNTTGNGPYAGVAAVSAGVALGPATAQVVAEGGSTETRPLNIYLNHIIKI